jgi:hypothetical protein
MIIRNATMGDLFAVLEIYAKAREFMQESGNPSQWRDGYPPQELVEGDIESGASYVCIDGNDIAAVFYFKVERDPSYEKIDGKWLDNGPCGVVHRIAKLSFSKGIGAFCLNWCFEQCGNLKMDTHRDNYPMRRLLDKLGFSHCGFIKLDNGEERMAFQKLAAQAINE